MAFEIKMPQLSDTMDAGKILTWRKKVGDSITRGDILAEVETDKANLEIEAFYSGTLLQVRTQEGSSAKVGETIAVIGEANEKVAESVSSATQSPVTASVASTPPQAITPNLQVVSKAATPLSPPTSQIESDGDRIKVSPLARKLAEQRNIELSGLQGSGPQGRIIKRDIDQAASGGPQVFTNLAPEKTERPQVSNPSISLPPGGRLTPLSKMRETIARRMQESVTQAPHFYVTTSVDMGQSIKLRAILKDREEYVGLSINHLIIKAVAYGIQHEPRVNNTIKDNQLFEPGQINIGIITAVNDGLLIPVIKEANTLALKDIVFEAKAAVERARAGRPNSSDLSGGTFSISNMGMYDVESFTAIINPGQGSVLAVSSIKEQPIVQNGHIVPGQIMKATISVDHRIIDGVMAGGFLKAFKEALEMPALLLA